MVGNIRWVGKYIDLFFFIEPVDFRPCKGFDFKSFVIKPRLVSNKHKTLVLFSPLFSRLCFSFISFLHFYIISSYIVASKQ